MAETREVGVILGKRLEQQVGEAWSRLTCSIRFGFRRWVLDFRKPVHPFQRPNHKVPVLKTDLTGLYSPTLRNAKNTFRHVRAH